MESIDWSRWTLATTDKLSFAGQECLARVLDVHDGDTVTLAAPLTLGSASGDSRAAHVTTMKCIRVRLAGINAPEVTSKDPTERAAAEAARYRLLELLTGIRIDCTGRPLNRGEMQDLLESGIHLARVKLRGFDKYGRILADVFSFPTTGIHVNQVLVSEGHARPFMAESG
jgi:endonuclease YncB( thermonuclease family)